MEIRIDNTNKLENKELVRLMGDSSLLDTPQYNLLQNPRSGNWKLFVLHKRKRRYFTVKHNVAIVDSILLIH